MGRQKSTAKTRLANSVYYLGGGLTLSGGGRYNTYSIYVLICLFVIWYRESRIMRARARSARPVCRNADPKTWQFQPAGLSERVMLKSSEASQKVLASV